MGEISDFQVGQTVQLSDGRLAKIKFTGSTHFAAGDWLGVELDDPNGKNDGAVQGQRYFDCEPAHGMFVRPSVATVLEKSAPKQSVHPQGRTNGLVTKGRPPSLSVGGVKRQSILDPAVMKRQSVDTGSPTPEMRPSVGSRLRVSQMNELQGV